VPINIRKPVFKGSEVLAIVEINVQPVEDGNAN
jgi:hypothetical protein